MMVAINKYYSFIMEANLYRSAPPTFILAADGYNLKALGSMTSDISVRFHATVQVPQDECSMPAANGTEDISHFAL